MFTTNKTFRNTWLQFKWKITKYQPKVMMLLAINLFFVLLGGISTSRTFMSIGSQEVQVVDYSILGFLVIECLIMFIFGTIVSSPNELKVNSYLPMNRTSATLSNVLYLFALSVLNAAITYSDLYITTAFQIIISSEKWFIELENVFSFGQFFMLILIFWMCCSFGYLYVSIGEINKLLMIALLVLIVWIIFKDMNLPKIVEWFVQGGTLFISLKSLIGALAAFTIALLITRKREVIS